MSPEEKLPEELKAFEAALASLVPNTDRLSRDRVMYLAGQAALGGAPTYGKVRTWAWPAAFTAMTAVTAMLAVLLVNRPEASNRERVGSPFTVSSEKQTVPNPPWPQGPVLLPEKNDFDDPLLAKSDFPTNWRTGSWQIFKTMAFDRPKRSATSAPKDDQPLKDSSLDTPVPTNRQLMEEFFQEDALQPMQPSS